MGTSGLQGVSSSPPNVLGVSGGNCITAPIAPKTCERSSLATDLGGIVPWGPTAPMTLQEYTEAKANAEHTGRIVYCTAPYHTMLYDTMPHHAMLYTPRYAAHTMPCHNAIPYYTMFPQRPGALLGFFARQAMPTETLGPGLGPASGTRGWRCLPQHAANRVFRRTSRAR